MDHQVSKEVSYGCRSPGWIEGSAVHMRDREEQGCDDRYLIWYWLREGHSEVRVEKEACGQKETSKRRARIYPISEQEDRR